VVTALKSYGSYNNLSINISTFIYVLLKIWVDRPMINNCDAKSKQRQNNRKRKYKTINEFSRNNSKNNRNMVVYWHSASSSLTA